MQPTAHTHDQHPVQFPAALKEDSWREATIPEIADLDAKAASIAIALRDLEIGYKILNYQFRPGSPGSRSEDKFRNIIKIYNTSTLQTYREIDGLLKTIKETHKILQDQDIKDPQFRAHLSKLEAAAGEFSEAIALYVFWLVKTYNAHHQDIRLTVAAKERIRIEAIHSQSHRPGRPESPLSNPSDSPRRSNVPASGHTLPPVGYPDTLSVDAWKKKAPLKLKNGKPPGKTGVSEILKKMYKQYRPIEYNPLQAGSESEIQKLIELNNKTTTATITTLKELYIRLIYIKDKCGLCDDSKKIISHFIGEDLSFHGKIWGYLHFMIENFNSQRNGMVIESNSADGHLTLKHHHR